MREEDICDGRIKMFRKGKGYSAAKGWKLVEQRVGLVLVNILTGERKLAVKRYNLSYEG